MGGLCTKTFSKKIWGCLRKQQDNLFEIRKCNRDSRVCTFFPIFLYTLENLESLLSSFFSKVSASESCSPNGYTILTINGIFTDLDGAIYNKDALKFIMTGATCVAVGTANYSNQDAMSNIVDELSEYLISNNLKSLSQIRSIL